MVFKTEARHKVFLSLLTSAKFLSTFDYTVDMGSSLPVSAPGGEDGMYHITFTYGDLSIMKRSIPA